MKFTLLRPLLESVPGDCDCKQHGPSPADQPDRGRHLVTGRAEGKHLQHAAQVVPFFPIAATDAAGQPRRRRGAEGSRRAERAAAAGPGAYDFLPLVRVLGPAPHFAVPFQADGDWSSAGVPSAAAGQPPKVALLWGKYDPRSSLEGELKCEFPAERLRYEQTPDGPRLALMPPQGPSDACVSFHELLRNRERRRGLVAVARGEGRDTATPIDSPKVGYQVAGVLCDLPVPVQRVALTSLGYAAREGPGAAQTEGQRDTPAGAHPIDPENDVTTRHEQTVLERGGLPARAVWERLIHRFELHSELVQALLSREERARYHALLASTDPTRELQVHEELVQSAERAYGRLMNLLHLFSDDEIAELEGAPAAGVAGCLGPILQGLQVRVRGGG